MVKKERTKRKHDEFELETSESDSDCLKSVKIEVNDELELETSESDGLNSMASTPRLLKDKPYVYGENSKEKVELDESLARMLAEDFQPYEIVEHKGLKRHSQMLNRSYIMPDCNTLANVVMPRLYEKVEGKLNERLQDARYNKI